METTTTPAMTPIAHPIEKRTVFALTGNLFGLSESISVPMGDEEVLEVEYVQVVVRRDPGGLLWRADFLATDRDGFPFFTPSGEWPCVIGSLWARTKGELADTERALNAWLSMRVEARCVGIAKA